MRFLHRVLPIVLAALPLGASTVNITSLSSMTVPTGDTLMFLVSEWNYSADAPLFSAPAAPTQVSFDMDVAAAGTGAADFSQLTAVLESRDGSVSISLADPNVYSGVAGYSYQGVNQSVPIWDIGGQVGLPETLSQELFARTSVYLIIANNGPAVTFSGLPGHTLGQGFTMDFGGGGLTVADPASQVLFDPPDVPEPGSAPLVLCGLAVMALAAWAAYRAGKWSVR